MGTIGGCLFIMFSSFKNGHCPFIKTNCCDMFNLIFWIYLNFNWLINILQINQGAKLHAHRVHSNIIGSHSKNIPNWFSRKTAQLLIKGNFNRNFLLNKPQPAISVKVTLYLSTTFYLHIYLIFKYVPCHKKIDKFAIHFTRIINSILNVVVCKYFGHASFQVSCINRRFWIVILHVRVCIIQFPTIFWCI